MYENTTSFISGITAVFGIFGVFFFIKLFVSLKNMNLDILKARVFLSNDFVINNVVIIFIVGLLIAIHNFIEYLGLGQPEFYYGTLAPIFPTRLFAVTELFVAILMVEWLMYRWIKIIKI
ncbi:MAG: hypothetical protein P1P69_05250 [Methanosarcinaceae archaeon]|nr:hypothetical protein [Methanosarcinaceae archaeon]